MATWDSAYLLDLFNRYASRPTVDEITDTEKYQWLTEAQAGVVADIAARCPWVLYSAPTQMTTSDGGSTFQFGTDSNGYAVFPFGNVLIYQSLGDIPDHPYTDYLVEGTQIRIPNNRTYSGTLYFRGIVPPADITAAVQPALFPEASRDLIALDAARRFTKTLNRPDLSADLEGDYARMLPRWLLVWRRQFAMGGALGSTSSTFTDSGVLLDDLNGIIRTGGGASGGILL